LKTKKLRIAMISMHSSPVGELGTRDTGGMSVYIGEVSRRLAAKGYLVDIFTRLQRPDGVKIIQPFPNARIIHLQAGPPEVVPQLVLCRWLPEFFEDLEHFRNTEGIKYDLVHSHYWLSGQVGHWAGKRWQVPHVIMFHTLGALKNEIAGSEPEPDARIAMEKQLAIECDLILASTEREKRHLIELCGALPQRIQVVPCGVDLERFRPSAQRDSRARLGLSGAEQVILYVGRFDPIKGIDRLLAAVAQVQRETRLRLVLVGGGGDNAPEDRALHAMCSALSLEDCVTFAGRRGHDELPDYYRAADALVLPSHYESFGLVVLEAMACGTPVIATRVGVVEDIVRNGVNGWVVEENGPESLAEGLRWGLARHNVQPPAANAIRATVEGYNWSSVASFIDREYRLLLAPGGIDDNAPTTASHSVCQKSALNRTEGAPSKIPELRGSSRRNS
jgi:D-inositol-3-phosphate glycosyltransferase